ncbi:MAG TPA: 1,4-alpha-glucan branching protein domain-containing protein [Thermoleophilaceae bacterium]
MTAGGRGSLAIVLHSHMPYVEGFGTWPFGEEWLWEAVASVYLPLLGVLSGQPVTLGLTPVLCDQLETLTGEAGERFSGFLRDIRAQVHDMDARELEQRGEPSLAAELRRAACDYTAADEAFAALEGDLLGAFRALPGVELWTSAATHAVLPLLATEPGRQLQISAGVASHERRFGGWSGGFWLPECAYEPGLERELAELGTRCFCVDQTNVFGLGSLDQLEPVATEAGPLAVPVDWQTVELIWGPQGYPGHATYRNYHGRTSHDLKPWNNGGGGYDHDAAMALAREHAAEFADHVAARLDGYASERGRPGLVCCALDTELIGHWWYEGPAFLAELLRVSGDRGVELVTLPGALDAFDPIEGRALEPSSWGKGKDLGSWDSPRVAGFAFAARAAELRTVAAAASGESGPQLERAARELLAVQASDWSFLTTYDLAGDYPRQRVEGHLAALDAALTSPAGPGRAPEPALRNLAPELDLSPLVAP